ncbi:AI-2E family transporter [Rhodococcoides kyotonense]|uniref:Predicted PurR-regulated permease PerM n=1 Tax=Rhodococcoides kyotonense TaxID=398843 RepID=A0A239LVD2_9NOCA|nr:AI-2E family transporter [Rhodococcus kyotonensis]SNT34421.1 Predicted PurR-regulated permease PerM [Rhodococcus kyotonensis]
MTQPEFETQRDTAVEPAAWSMPRGVIVLLGIAALVVAVAGTRAFSGVVGPTFLALMLTVAVHPFPDWLRRKGFPTWLATVSAILVVYAILGVLVLSLVLSTARLATLLPTYADDFDGLVADVQKLLSDNGIGQDQIHQLLSELDASTIFGLLDGILTGALGIFSNLLFVLVLLLFMAVDGSTYSSRTATLLRTRPDIAGAFRSFSSGTRTYLVVSTVFGLIVAVIDAGALWAMGIPLPILWGLLSFITNYIPNIGFVIGVIPPALIALLQGGPTLMIAVIVVYSVVNVVIQSIIQPKFVGDAVGLSVTLTFLSLVFWSWVLGPLGAILAIPLTLMAKALLVDIDPATRWVDVLVSSGPPAEVEETGSPPPVQDSDDAEVVEGSPHTDKDSPEE